jgi:hypothetical protein
MICVNSYIKKRFLPLFSEAALAFFSAIVVDAFLLGLELLLASLQPFITWCLCFSPFGFQWLFEDFMRWKWKWLLEGEKN